MRTSFQTYKKILEVQTCENRDSYSKTVEKDKETRRVNRKNQYFTEFDIDSCLFWKKTANVAIKIITFSMTEHSGEKMQKKNKSLAIKQRRRKSFFPFHSNYRAVLIQYSPIIFF